MSSAQRPSSAAGDLLKKRIESRIGKNLKDRSTQRLTRARLLQLSLASKARPGAITKCENEYYETGGKKAGNL